MNEPYAETRHRSGDEIVIPGDCQYRALHEGYPAQRLWHYNKLCLIDRVLPARSGTKVLDLGCGSGVIADHLARQGARVIAVDSNPAAIDFARMMFTNPSITFQHGQFSEVIENDFDAAYCLEVIEHLYPEQVEATLRLAGARLRPHAMILLTTPNYRSLWPLIEWTIDRFELAHALDEAQHITHFTAARLRSLLEDTGWHVKELGSFNGLAPFAAGLSQRLAARLCRWELRWKHFRGFNLLYAVAEKP